MPKLTYLERYLKISYESHTSHIIAQENHITTKYSSAFFKIDDPLNVIMP